MRTRCFDVTHGLDLEVKGFVKGAKGAFRAPSVWHARACFRNFHDAIFYSSAIQSEHISGCVSVVRTEMQCVLYQ